MAHNLNVLNRCAREARERIRSFVHRHASTHVLVLGDSHVRVFEHWRFLWSFPRTRFDVVYIPGGTATGIRNRSSTTGAYSAFLKALSTQAHDLVLINLGEVDTAYTLWRQADKDGKNVADLMAVAVKNYCTFLDEVHREHRVAVLSACLPTLSDHADASDEVAAVRTAVKASQHARTSLALEFNAQVSAFCGERGIPYLNCGVAALGPDGIVRPEWVNQKRYDHHYARSTYARWLVKALRKISLPSGVSSK